MKMNLTKKATHYGKFKEISIVCLTILLTICILTPLISQDRKPPVSRNPIKNWEYRKFEKYELVGIFKGKEAIALSKDEFDITKPTALIYTKPQGKEQQVKRLNISADKGLYNDKNRLFTLYNNVIVEVIEDKAILNTTNLTIDTDKKALHTDSPFTLTSPNLVCKGTGLDASETFSKIIIQKDTSITKIEEKNKTYINADYAEIYLERANKTQDTFEGYEITQFIALSKDMSRVETNGNIACAPKIIGYKNPDIIILKGPKYIKFGEYTASSDGDILLLWQTKIIKLFSNATINGKDMNLSSENMIIKLTADGKNIEETVATGQVKVWDKLNNTYTYGDILKQDFSTRITTITGMPYVITSRENAVMKVGELTFNQKTNIIEGRRGQERSIIIFSESKNVK